MPVEGAGTPAPGAETAEQGATTDVEYAFEMPDGITLDATRRDEFVAIAKELKLPKDAAAKLVGMETARIQAEQQQQADMVAGWASTVQADPVLGTPENQAIAVKVVDTFGTPELKTWLSSTGVGNHPELVKFAYNVGKAMSEDAFVKGSPPAAPVSKAKQMFPSMN